MGHCASLLRAVFFLLFLGLSGRVFCQSQLKGIYIVNADTKVPVQDAFVQNEDASFNASADENGFVSFRNLPVSSLQLLISRIGFEVKRVAVDTLTGTNNTAIIYLNSKVSSLQEVQVKATANGGIFKTISDLDIHLRPINNSQEVLRMVPGLFIGQHAGGGKAEQIFLRGFDLDHGTDINISVDGIPVNMVSHAHGQGYADLHFVIPELIDKVNFNKGPYFADKGNFTTAGFVEFKTKDYLENNFVKLEGGQFNTFRGITGINLLKSTGDRRNQSLYFAGEASYSDGYFDHPQNFSRFNGILKYHGSVSPTSTISASITGFTSKWNASGQIPDRAVESGMIDFYGAIDSTEGGKTSRYNANVELLTNLHNGGAIRNQVYYTRYKFELYSNFTFYKEDPVNGDQIRQKEDRNIYGYNGSYRKEYFFGNIKTETNAGVQLRYGDINNIELTRTKDRVVNTAEIMRGDIHELNAGAYWSQRFSLSKKLDVTGGLRADYFTNQYNDKLTAQVLSTNSAIVSPKLNVNYKLNDKVQLYLYNGRGFHSNDTRVAVRQDGKKVLPPAYGTDLGGIFKVGRNLVLQSALWYLWLDQEFIYVGDEGVVEPGGKTRRYGFDFSARYEVLNNLYADADISLANPRALEVDKANSYLPLAPRFTSVGGLTYRKELGWNGSLRYRYMADRPANEDNSVIAKGYFVTDAAINYTKRNWEAGIAIQNLFNVKWKETQFDTESRLQNEPAPVSEIHFTAGTPFFARASFTLFF
ncbi:TonB-dependent receptor [Flavisolibacter nicotianae]|uniref:TonB-dependent receptor n=1 Tax=Flavisolibacter nicotianae TaxID=2364882 RepID=UPI000EAF7FCE|nr:TonB-dependent receptor [Flavisolibacter nicotianae]